MENMTNAAVMNNARTTDVSTTNGFSVDKLFRAKSAATAVTETKALTPGVKSAVAQADALSASYTQLKVDVLDRSDRALWALLEQVYAYALAVESSPLKRETRSELNRVIKQRGGQGLPESASTAAFVVRYVFADVSRQSRSNYTIAMEKAAALGVTTDTFAAFLTEYGGVSKVVEHVFDHEAADTAVALANSKAVREEKQSRTGLVGKLYSVMAQAATEELEYSGTVMNWVPEKQVKEGKAAGKDETPDPKYERGNFVLFLTVQNPDTGKYHVVQGNVFNKAFEAQLLGTIAEQMGADTQELQQAVAELEQQQFAAQLPRAA